MGNRILSADRNRKTSQVEVIASIETEVVISPELVAEVFWLMDEWQQAAFFNALSALAEHSLPFQLQAVIDSGSLTLMGRTAMRAIGEYGEAATTNPPIDAA